MHMQLCSCKHNNMTSLSVVFEDLDRSKVKALLAEQYLYLFSNRATVKKWKQYYDITKETVNEGSTKHIQGTEEQHNKDVKLSLQPATPSVYKLPATQA